jgi:flagellar hook-basal body complex protein FliE
MGFDYLSTVNGVTPGVVTPKVSEAPLRREEPAAPFQKFLDMAVSALEDVSQMETQTNNLINQYVEGKASLQEVMTATAKMNIAIQLAVTVTNSAVTAFKEITQMAV